MKPSSIGTCVYVLFHKKWSKTLVNGQLKAQSWWENQLKTLIEAPAITIPKELIWDGKPAEPVPIPYEIEYELV